MDARCGFSLDKVFFLQNCKQGAMQYRLNKLLYTHRMQTTNTKISNEHMQDMCFGQQIKTQISYEKMRQSCN